MIRTALPLLVALLLQAPAAQATFSDLNVIDTSTQAALNAEAAEPKVYYRHLLNFAGRSLADATCGSTFEACCPGSVCDAGNVCRNDICRTCGVSAQPACEVNGALQCNAGFTERNGFCFTALGGLFNFNTGGGGTTIGTTPTVTTTPDPTPAGTLGTTLAGVYGPPPAVAPPSPPPPPVVVVPPPTTVTPPPPPTPVVPPPAPVAPPPPVDIAPAPGAPPVTRAPDVLPAPAGAPPNDVDTSTPPGQVPPRIVIILVPPTARPQPFSFAFFACGFPGSSCCITVLPFISSAYCFGSSTCQTDTLFPQCEATPVCSGVRVGNTCNTFF